MVWWGPLAQIGIALLRLVGRWVLRRVSLVGRRRILHYMSEKISTFHRKGAKALEKGKRLRARWYDFRIRNWIRVRDWLKENWARLSKKAARLLDEKINHVADQVEPEDYELWKIDPHKWEAVL